MVKRDDITKFLYQTLGQDLIDKAWQTDTAPNCVQINGVESVDKVALGVSASLGFIEAAIKDHAGYLICHHGIHTAQLVNGRFDLYEQRLHLIFQHNLTFAGFHYSLDAHPVLGNNAQIIRKLGAARLDEPYFDSWGWIGEFKTPQDVKSLAAKVSKLVEHDVFAVYSGPTKVKRFGVCSGGAVPHHGEWFKEMIDHHLDLHLTGEIRESSPYLAEEAGINYFACGHYATEVFGVQALGQALKKHFGSKLEVEFLDVPSTL